MTSDIHYRLVEPDDLATLLHIYESSYPGSMESGLQSVSRHPESQRVMIHAEFARREQGYRRDFPALQSHIIVIDEEAAGRVYTEEQDGCLFIIDLILLPDFRGQGHGTILLRQFIAHAHTQGKRVRLHVEKRNVAAHRLYARLGFRMIDETAGTHWLLELPPAPGTYPSA